MLGEMVHDRGGERVASQEMTQQRETFQFVAHRQPDRRARHHPRQEPALDTVEAIQRCVRADDDHAMLLCQFVQNDVQLALHRFASVNQLDVVHEQHSMSAHPRAKLRDPLQPHCPLELSLEIEGVYEQGLLIHRGIRDGGEEVSLPHPGITLAEQGRGMSHLLRRIAEAATNLQGRAIHVEGKPRIESQGWIGWTPQQKGHIGFVSDPHPIAGKPRQ